MSDRPDPPTDLAQGLYGCMSLIVQRVALDAHSTPGAVLLHFADKLGRFLLPRSAGAARLDVAWRGRGWSIGVEWQSPELGPRAMSAERLAELERRYLQPHTEHETWEPNSVWWWGERCDAVRIALAATPDKGALEIRYAGSPVDNERWEWFVMYVRGLRELHHIVYGLITARVGLLREQYNTQIQSLRNARTASLHDTLTAAHALLPKLLEIGAMDLVEELLTLLVLHVFGTGWRVRPLRRQVPGSLEHGVSATLLGELIAGVRDHAPSLGPTHPARILSLARCLEAVIAPTGSPIAGTASAGDEMFAALAMWTHVHELWRGVKRVPKQASDCEAAWLATRERTLPVLVERLARSPVTRTPLAHSRHWLTMWFCLELLNPRDSWAAEDPDSWDEVRAELAYALRETIRYDLFGDRVDYFHDASLLVNAVARLVEFHATSVVGIPPEYHVTGLMELIRLEGGANRFSVIEHLQHVADIYIAGHFLLSLQVKRADRVEPAEQLLARGTADKDELGKYRRAFSLAALFHDVGHILLPSDAPLPGARLLEEAVLEVFRGRSESARAHAKAVTARCIEQLGLGDPGNARHVTPGPHAPTYFHHERERQDFKSYLDRQAGEGRFNHGLLGAWYLDRTCVQAEGSWREANTAMHECRKMAVRAILLHDIVTAEIDAEQDPIAALLVTCNEVFEWSPARQAIRSPSTLERLPRGAGASIPTARVDRSIEILGFGSSSDAASRFGAEITAQDDHWPVVVVSLVPSEYLDVPVYRIWLAKAQEMGRIKPSKASGFAPALWIRSAPDPRFHHCGLSIRSGLKKALSQDRSRPEIVEWCSSSKRFHPTSGYPRLESNGETTPAAASGPAASGEEVRLSYLPRRLCPGNIEDEMPEIVRIVDAYLESIENEQLRALTE